MLRVESSTSQATGTLAGSPAWEDSQDETMFGDGAQSPPDSGGHGIWSDDGSESAQAAASVQAPDESDLLDLTNPNNGRPRRGRPKGTCGKPAVRALLKKIKTRRAEEAAASGVQTALALPLTQRKAASAQHARTVRAQRQN